MSWALGLGISALVGGSVASGGEWQALARVGTCSGVLVASDVVVTSGHCLDGPIERVAVGKRSGRPIECRRDPQYQGGQRLHDIGLCMLSWRSEAAPIPLDRGPAPAVGVPVVLAGFGRTGAFTHDGDTPRTVETSVSRAGTEGIDVGSAERTACPGDSGGPVLVGEPSKRRTVAIIHGATGAICASPAQAVAVEAELGWLLSAAPGLSVSEETGPSHLLAPAATLIAVIAMASTGLVYAVQRRLARRFENATSGARGTSLRG